MDFSTWVNDSLKDYSYPLPSPEDTFATLNGGKIFEKIHALFSRFGVPEKLVSDNGTQFMGSEFRNFCRSLSVEHVTTPPYHPWSNEQAEKFVDTFKKGIKEI